MPSSVAAPPSSEAPAPLPNLVPSSDAPTPSAELDLTTAIAASSAVPPAVPPPPQGLSDSATLTRLAAEPERLSHVVEGLDQRSLSGPTTLERRWKELQDAVDAACSHLTVSVARCYPAKTRFADVLPFDATRVPLPSARDDYVNASYVRLMASSPESCPLVLTQAPLPNTFADFWAMAWEAQAEVIACLNSDAEVKAQRYLPVALGEAQDFGPVSVQLHAQRDTPGVLLRRVLHVTHRQTKLMRVVIQLQFLGWPAGAMPDSPAPLLAFLQEVSAAHAQQRNKLHPVVVHCVSGLGRSYVAACLLTYVRHLAAAGVAPDAAALALEVACQRHGGVQDKEHLYFLLWAALYHAQEVLMRHGILSASSNASFADAAGHKTKHVRHPSEDLLNNDLANLKTKLGFSEAPPQQQQEQSQPEEPPADANAAPPSSTEGAPSDALNDALSDAASDALSDAPKSPKAASRILDASVSALAPRLAASLDPSQFCVAPPSTSQRITKGSFGEAQGIQPSEDPGDPFSGIDPLWSYKK